MITQDTHDTSQDAAKALATPVAAESIQFGAAAEFAARLGSRRRNAGAPVRTLFVSDEEAVPKPPLAQLLSAATGGNGGGGRGGQLRAKLYVSLLWVCAKEPYNVARPARAWSALLGLDNPETKGVRRVQQAFRDLADRELIEVQDRGGFASIITVLSERGDGSPYIPPSEVHNNLVMAKAPESELLPHRYFRVPSTVWTQGHIAKMSGPAFAMLLALLSEQRGNDRGVWFSPDRAKARFGFSTSTRQQGLEDLRHLGLVHTSTRVVSESGAYIDFARRRSVHQVTGL